MAGGGLRSGSRPKRRRGGGREAPPRLDLSMLDIEFAQATDSRPSARPQRGLSRVRRSRAPAARRSHGAGCSRWPMESAATIGARSLRAWPSRRCWPDSARAAQANVIPLAAAAPGAAGQCQSVYETGMASRPGRRRHGHHHRHLRAALRPRGGLPRGRFALLSGPPRPRRSRSPAITPLPAST